MVRHERPRRRAAVQRLHHRCFHFDEVARFELPAERRDDFRSCDERLPDVRIGDQVEIPLAIPRLDVLQAVPLFRHGEQDFG